MSPRRRRDYGAEYRRRQARARERGFRSFFEQRRARPRRITGRSDLARLPGRAHAKRNDALHALADVRRYGFSVDAAALKHGIAPDAVRFWVGDALDRDADRLARPMLVLGRDGPTEVVVRGSRAASEVAEHANAVRHFLETGDRSLLARFRGRQVAGVPLETSPRALLRLAREGALDVEYLYTEVAS